VDAEESDLPFRQVDGQMIGVFRHFVEYKFADEIRSTFCSGPCRETQA
jgi:hypothetical protein